MIQAVARLLARYSDINWALADQAVISGVNFLTGILLARYLGLEGFGQFTLAWMAVLFVNALQHATIIAPMMSIGPKQPAADLPAYYGAVIVQQVAFSLCVFVFLFAAIEASPLVFPDWGLSGLGHDRRRPGDRCPARLSLRGSAAAPATQRRHHRLRRPRHAGRRHVPRGVRHAQGERRS